MPDKIRSFLLRLPVFLAGILISSFGVALSAKCNLGITPISSPPYVLSLLLPLSMGTVTIIMHFLFVAAQILLLRKRFPPKDLLQLALAILYGRFMDFSTFLLRGLEPGAYPVRLGLCLLGVCVVAFGVFLTIKADVLFLAGEGLVSAISKVSGREFGKVKIAVDSSLLAFAAAASLIFLHRLAGIREGTLIAAIGVGLMVQVYGRLFSALFPRAAAPAEEPPAAGHLVVTIAREFDPKSMLIVKRLAEITGLKLFDDELIALTAEESGLPLAFVRESEDRLRKGLLQSLYETSFEYPTRAQYGDREKAMYLAQRRVILRLVNSTDCIIIGRTANRILGKGPNYFHIYLHAKPQRRVERTAKRFHITLEEAEVLIACADEQRRQNYDFYIGRVWGLASDYNLCLDVTHCDVEKTARFLQLAIADFTWQDSERRQGGDGENGD